MSDRIIIDKEILDLSVEVVGKNMPCRDLPNIIRDVFCMSANCTCSVMMERLRKFIIKNIDPDLNKKFVLLTIVLQQLKRSKANNFVCWF